jgi:hypothetical protein
VWARELTEPIFLLVVRHVQATKKTSFDLWGEIRAHLLLRTRVTRWVCKKIAQNGAQPIFRGYWFTCILKRGKKSLRKKQPKM